MFGVSPNLPEVAPDKWGGVCNYYLNMYDSCKAFHVLPRAGALDAQDWLTMFFFDVIRGAIAEEEAKLYKQRKS